MEVKADTKQAYQAKAKAQLDKLNAQISELKAKSEQAKADAQIKYQDQLVELYTKRDAAQSKFKELQQSSIEAWAEVQKGFEAAWTELNHAWKNAKAKF
ncbi:MAG: hypothetical protein AAGF83_14220 [Cyanobacteria bacterium P01_G01_bin.67]